MQTFEVGDKVALIHEKSMGIITGITNKSIIIYVEDMEMDIEVDAKSLMLVEKKRPEPIIEPKENIQIEPNLTESIENLKKQGLGHQTNKVNTKNKVHLPTEIDLHWEVLQKTNPNYANIPPEAIDEIFRIQRLEFENFFLKALSYNLHIITIIHGIGAGKLRDYVHAYIKRHEKNIDSFQVMNDGGLTQVIFKLN